jgi:hypothetical protein
MIIVNIMKPSWGTLTHWQLSNGNKNMAQAMSSRRCQHASIKTNKQPFVIDWSQFMYTNCFLKEIYFAKHLQKCFANT